MKNERHVQRTTKEPRDPTSTASNAANGGTTNVDDALTVSPHLELAGVLMFASLMRTRIEIVFNDPALKRHGMWATGTVRFWVHERAKCRRQRRVELSCTGSALDESVRKCLIVAVSRPEQLVSSPSVFVLFEWTKKRK